ILLVKHDIFQKWEFKEWCDDFNKVYGKKQTTLQLYCINALLYFIGFIFISKFILRNKNSLFNQNKPFKEILRVVKSEIASIYTNIDLFGIKYFKPTISLSEKENINSIYSLLKSLSKFIFELKIPPEYYFDFLIQKLISPTVRHKSGEYYTPPFLVKMMVRDTYIFGETVLDPCCGTGNFLTEIVKMILSQKKSREDKITAINSLYGLDINPISIYITKINLLYLVRELNAEIILNVYIFDSLYQRESNFSNKFDLVISNPPWYTYRDIESIDYQEKAKILAEQLKIKPQPKNLLNLEISTLFFYKAKNTYMKEGAKIFFVMTKGVITGSHTSRFRNFEGFSNIKIWVFNRKVERIFNIDFICLFGKKSSSSSLDSNQEIKSYCFKLTNDTDQIEYFNDVDLDLEKVETLIAYNVEKKAGNVYTKKLIPKRILKDLLPIKESYYKPLFHKGADLNPRNLIFVKCKESKDSLIKIDPDERIFKRAKKPWNRNEFKNEIVEKKYIFKVIKSTELVKFYVYDYYEAFLPLSKNDLNFDYTNLDKNAKLFYDKINNFYKKYKKETTKHADLIDNLNRWSKLINNRQLAKTKVVFNNSGSVLQSAVIQGDYLITGDLSFYATENLDEAFYLSAILNSILITKQVQIMKSSRHIFKLPLDIPIRKYNTNNPNHQVLANLGRKGQEIVIREYHNFIKDNKNRFSKFMIQNLIYEKLESVFSQIDEILMKEFDQK
ncbi:MAG: N-6 DNA methylase, partial [Candidatus Lokiarchaeia archaeon]|nr:N-6 DNA methylase [Candidatus Lokiarchaeia archaeon]